MSRTAITACLRGYRLRRSGATWSGRLIIAEPTSLGNIARRAPSPLSLISRLRLDR